MKRDLAVILLLMLSVVAEADTEVAWIHVSANLTYKGAASSCKTVSPSAGFYVAAEIQDGVPSRVVLSNYRKVFPYEKIYKAIELTKAQVAHVQFFRDVRGTYWLKKLPLSEALLKWALVVPAERSSQCRFPHRIASITPSKVDYAFETDDINEGILLSYSQKAEFSGRDVQGQEFEAALRFVQREYKP